MIKMTILFVLITLTMSSLKAQNKVYVNNKKAPISQLQKIKSKYGISIGDGQYWYDSKCGAWGYKNGPTMGFIPAYLELGGPLQSNASNGRTGVFVNGRELPRDDVKALQRIINVVPGRFWLDEEGNGGYEGQYATFNLIYLSRKKGGNGFYRNSYTGTGSGSSGGTSYVIGKDWSVITN
ncbi:MAG: hypothetical protein AAGD17_07205 [Bacteroidota bacterium]